MPEADEVVVNLEAVVTAVTMIIPPRIVEYIKWETKHVSEMGTNGDVTLTLLFRVTDSLRHSRKAGNIKINGQDKGRWFKEFCSLASVHSVFGLQWRDPNSQGDSQSQGL